MLRISKNSVSFANILYGAAALLLAACAHTPLTSVYKLSKVNAQTTDLAKLRVAVQIPVELQPAPEGVIMKASLSETADEPEVVEDFILEQALLPVSMTEMRSYRRADRRIYVFKLAPIDVERFDNFRKLQVGGNKKAKRSGSLAILSGVCRTTAKMPRNIPVSTFLRTSETGEFVPLLINVDLMNEVKGSNPEAIAPRC